MDALFLALLLARAPLPVIRDCQVEEVHLQAEHLGWKTDDVLIVARGRGDVRRHLAAQVKRHFTVSGADETCTKTFADFWADFTDSTFDPAQDRLALVTLRGTRVLLEGLGGLLDCARASADAADFMHRLEVDGYLSKKARGYAKTIRKIIEDAAGEAPGDDAFWRFLTLVHLVSFDLNTDTAQTESWIKTLLAMSANEPDPVAMAEASWRELLELAGAGMPAARSFRYQNLPEPLRARHAPVDTKASRVLQTLAAHGGFTLDKIRTQIARTEEIPRAAVTIEILDALSESQAVVVTAPAGLGKSALAKRCVELLSREVSCFAFRAEEFAASHIDRVLMQAQVPVNGEELLGILAGQGRKIILVDSVERLLEASDRNAFSDLLSIARRDGSLRLLLTCRDYQLETVSSALLEEAGLFFKVVEVPPLSDEELERVAAALPHLANAVRHEGLRRLLRSPYMLDKAAQMDWSETEGLPVNEREFRKRCWGEVIRRDAEAGGGMPQRREEAFEQVALRRARELRPFVETGELDAAALEALRNDNLLTESAEAGSLAAPAHDVLEDWAIIQWLGERWLAHERDPALFAQEVGGSPAIRRGYRRWLSEMLQCEAAAASDFVLAVFRNAALPAQFRDDTLVSTLQSAWAREFLQRSREALLADGGRLLVRVIHLLRVACKTPPWWLRDAAGLPSQLLVASGDAWPAVLELVLGRIERIAEEHTPVLVGLVEDFAGSVSWDNPEPKGFQEAARIAFALLERLDSYRMDDMRKRVLKVISKVPHGDPPAFCALVERAIAGERSDRLADEVADLLLGGVDGWTACRYFPEELIRLARAKLLLGQDDVEADDWRRDSSINIEPFFGLRHEMDISSYPASAIRGLLRPLLRYHPRRGVEFIIELLNHAGSWYGEQRWPHDRLEPAEPITMEVPGEGPVTQWANARLWNLYRGHSVGPYPLQSALMALEAWLLEIAELEGVNLEPWLLRILRESNNVMATGVLTSVCNAHPEKGGRAALALLSSHELIRMDLARTVHERGQPAMSEIFASFGVNKFYDDERKKSDALPHRRHHLETLALKLQLTEGREQVFEIIDRHRAQLPPVEEQSEEHRLWRLALHRMDARGLRPGEEEVEGGTAGDSSDGEGGRRWVPLVPGQIEPDVQELIDRHVPVAERQERDLSLLNWGLAAWERKESSHVDVRDWRGFLGRARACDGEAEPEDFARGGPGIIAAVCCRDHWESMNPEERAWCVEKLIQEVEKKCDSEDDMIRHSRGAFQPDRCAAGTLPGLLARELPDARKERIGRAVANALTHAADEVALYAADGVGYYARGGQRDFSDQCVAALALRGRLIAERLIAEEQKPWEEQVQARDIVRETIPTVRTAIVNGAAEPDEELERLNLDFWPGRQAASTILQILGHQPDSELAIRFHRRVVEWMLRAWDRGREERGSGDRRDHHFEHEFLQRLARFALKLGGGRAREVCGPLITGVARHPEEVRHFIQNLVLAEDEVAGESPFWDLWQAFADAVCSAPWIGEVDSRYARGKELVRTMFLGGGWKDNIRHWPRMEDEGRRVDALAARLRGSVTAFEGYCRFLHDIGERSLPGAFVALSESLAAGEAAGMLSGQNTVFELESLLRRYVFGEPLRLKSDPAVRAAVLSLLDHLVEAGSSSGYRMRDDFVTPLDRAASG